MKKIKNLWIKSLEELNNLELNDLKKELFNSKKRLFELKMKLKMSELKQTHLIKILRRYIAAVNTVVRNKQINTF